MSSLEHRVSVLERLCEELRAAVSRIVPLQEQTVPSRWFMDTAWFDTGSGTLPSAAPVDVAFDAAPSLTRGKTPADNLNMGYWVECPASGNVVGFRAVIRLRNSGQALRIPFTLTSSATAGTTGRFVVRVDSVAQTDGHISIPQGVHSVGVYAYLKTAPGHALQLVSNMPQTALVGPEEMS